MPFDFWPFSSEDDKTKAYSKLQEIMQQKSEKLAQLKILEQALSQKSITFSEYNEQVTKLKKEIKEITSKIDDQLLAVTKLAAEKPHEQDEENIEYKAVELAKERVSEKLHESEQKLKEQHKKNLLQGLIIKRYADHIESNESKTINGLKGLVKPTDSAIRLILEQETQKLTNKEDMMELCQRLFLFTKEIDSLPGISTTFWLKPAEIIENKIADYDDKAIFLCSLFRAANQQAKVVMVSLQNNTTRPLVLLSINKKEILCDPNQDYDFLKFAANSQKEALQGYSFNNQGIAKINYEFNDREYEQGNEL